MGYKPPASTPFESTTGHGLVESCITVNLINDSDVFWASSFPSSVIVYRQIIPSSTEKAVKYSFKTLKPRI